MPTLIDGTDVASDAEAWRAECEARRLAALGSAGAMRAECEAMRKLGRPEAGVEQVRRDAECLRHVTTLQDLGARQARADYLSTLTAADPEMAGRVKAAFLAAWERAHPQEGGRQGAAEAAVRQQQGRPRE